MNQLTLRRSTLYRERHPLHRLWRQQDSSLLLFSRRLSLQSTWIRMQLRLPAQRMTIQIGNYLKVEDVSKEMQGIAVRRLVSNRPNAYLVNELILVKRFPEYDEHHPERECGQEAQF